MKITVTSDTHSRHKFISKGDLPGGDLLIHAGDITMRGYETEVIQFLDWFSSLYQYETKIFIAGNHDFYFEENPTKIREILKRYPDIIYLENEHFNLNGIKIFGSPIIPNFNNWAFNVDRMSERMIDYRKMIPKNTDILITHTPPKHSLDVSNYMNEHCGCEVLETRIDEIKPKINVFGHVHSSYGYKFNGHTHMINASALGARNEYQNPPLTFEWDKKENDINFLNIY